MRFELPYQERLLRIGIELGRRLHEHGIELVGHQLTEYQALPRVARLPRRLGAGPGDQVRGMARSRTSRSG
jgi:phenylacetyl-CoA:acceptor oxidoreductase